MFLGVLATIYDFETWERFMANHLRIFSVSSCWSTLLKTVFLHGVDWFNSTAELNDFIILITHIKTGKWSSHLKYELF